MMESRRGFLRRLLDLVGASFIEEENTILISKSFIKEFGEEEVKIKLFCDDENNLESPFLEKLYRICMNRGETTSFILERDSAPIDVLEEINFINLNVERGGSFKSLKYGIIFYFQVSLTQPEYLRKISYVAVDPESLEPLDWIKDGLLYCTDRSIVNTPKKGFSKKRIQEVYCKACILLKERLDLDLRDVVKKNEKHIQKDSERISRYYRKLRVEEENRIERLESQLSEIARKIEKHRTLETFERYLDEKRRITRKLEEERYKIAQYLEKLDEFELKEKKREIERHEIICNVDLIAVSLIQYNAIRDRLLLFSDDAKAMLEVYSIPLVSKVEWPICQSCKKPTQNIGLSHNSHIVCSKCLYTCSNCGSQEESAMKDFGS